MSKVVCQVSCGWFVTRQWSTIRRPFEIDSNQIETLIENSECYTMKQITDLPKISKALKIICIDLVMLIILMFAFHINYRIKLFCMQFSIEKHNKHIPFLKQLWQVMKSGYCAIIWNGRYYKASEMNHHQPQKRPVFIKRRWYCVYGGIGRESTVVSSFGKIKRLIPKSTAPNKTNWKPYSIKSVQN